AGSMLGGENAVLPAGAHAGRAVGHAHAHALLAAEDRPDVEIGAGVDQRIARIAGEKLGPLALEDFGNDVGALHWCPVRLMKVGRKGSRTGANAAPALREALLGR